MFWISHTCLICNHSKGIRLSKSKKNYEPVRWHRLISYLNYSEQNKNSLMKMKRQTGLMLKARGHYSNAWKTCVLKGMSVLRASRKGSIWSWGENTQDKLYKQFFRRSLIETQNESIMHTVDNITPIRVWASVRRPDQRAILSKDSKFSIKLWQPQECLHMLSKARDPTARVWTVVFKI